MLSLAISQIHQRFASETYWAAVYAAAVVAVCDMFGWKYFLQKYTQNRRLIHTAQHNSADFHCFQLINASKTKKNYIANARMHTHNTDWGMSNVDGNLHYFFLAAAVWCVWIFFLTMRMDGSSESRKKPIHSVEWTSKDTTRVFVRLLFNAHLSRSRYVRIAGATQAWTACVFVYTK